MVYSDTGPRKIFAVAIVVVGISFLVYGVFRQQIRGWIKTQNFMSQVNQFSGGEIQYIQSLNSQIPLNNITHGEEFSAIMQTSLQGSGLSQQESLQVLQNYLNQLFGIDTSAPAVVKALVIDVALQYQKGAVSSSSLSLSGGSSKILQNQSFSKKVLNTLNEHGAKNNKQSTLQRQFTTQNLLQDLFNEL